jgi:phosphate acetyltransferase
MSIRQLLMARARARPRRIAFPEGEDQQLVRAACRLAAEGIARPVVLGREEQVRVLAGREWSEGVEIADPTDAEMLARYSQIYAARRQGVSEGIALRLVRRPLFFGAMMVATGAADAMVAGLTRPTAQVVTAAALSVGYREGISQASSFFLMVLPGPPEQVLVFADAAVAVDPSAAELAEIAVLTSRNTRTLLDIEPRVALLSFSTHGSASHPRVKKVREALERVRELDPDLICDGELQADAALSSRVAGKKCPDSPLGGEANVLVFPDLDSGNIAYKLTQYLAGAQAIGPIMQGFRKPVCDLSRGASVEDIVDVAAIASLQVSEAV